MRFKFTDGPLKGKSPEVNKDRVIVGRDESCDVVVPDDEVSRKHAELTRSGDRIEVRDLDSQNGTKVERSRVTEAREVSSSDKITIGDSVFTVEADVGAGATRGGGRTKVAGGTVGGTKMAGSVPAMLEVVSGPDKGKTIDVTAKGVTVGRDSKADLTLGDDEASREHVEVRANADGSVEVRDLGSRNGTEVDGRKISRTVTVSEGAEIGVGRSRLKVSSLTAAKRSRAPLWTDRRPSLGAIAAVLGGLAAVVVILLVAGVIGGGEDEESSEPLATSEIVQKLQPSTVQVLLRQAGRTQSFGSGWVLDNQEGLIVTNAHVVEGAPDGARYAVGIDDFPRRAEVWAVAPCEDVAILRTAAIGDLPNMPLGTQDDVEAGEKAIALGYPSNLTLADELQVTEGTVSVAETRAETQTIVDPDFPLYENVIQMDTPLNPGNSGGPLVDDKGELIGMNTFGATALQNTNYAVGVDRIKEITDQMRGGDSLGYAGFGFVATGPLPGGPGGLIVNNVLPNGGADQIGIPVGTPITAVNGRPVETRSDYCNAVENVASGDDAQVSGPTGSGRVIFD